MIRETDILFQSGVRAERAEKKEKNKNVTEWRAGKEETGGGERSCDQQAAHRCISPPSQASVRTDEPRAINQSREAWREEGVKSFCLHCEMIAVIILFHDNTSRPHTGLSWRTGADKWSFKFGFRPYVYKWDEGKQKQLSLSINLHSPESLIVVDEFNSLLMTAFYPLQLQHTSTKALLLCKTFQVQDIHKKGIIHPFIYYLLCT